MKSSVFCLGVNPLCLIVVWPTFKISFLQNVDFKEDAIDTGKNNGFPFLDILGYLKNTHKNPKFGRVRQVPMWELSWEFPDWDLSSLNFIRLLRVNITPSVTSELTGR